MVGWHRSPIPRVNNPLPRTPCLVAIACQAWCRGDPWTILRNRIVFIHNTIDECRQEDTDFLSDTIPRISWVEALRGAYPGEMSYINWRFWTKR